MVESAGLVIISNNEILLVHPTGASWDGTYSIPKGEMDDFESSLHAAIRETKEEIGIDFSSYLKDHNGNPDGVIEYKKSGTNKVYKKVFYFILVLNDDQLIDTMKLLDIMDRENREVDWAGFVGKNDAEERIFHRFKPILEKVFELES